MNKEISETHLEKKERSRVNEKWMEICVGKEVKKMNTQPKTLLKQQIKAFILKLWLWK